MKSIPTRIRLPNLIFDEFEELLFDGNPLGRNILGNEKSLKIFTPDSIRRFYQTQLQHRSNGGFISGRISVQQAGEACLKPILMVRL